MPRSYDLNPVKITHHPTQRLDTALGKLPPFDVQQIIDGFLTALKDLTGIDLTGIRDFLENMFGSIDWSNLPDAGDVWQFVVTTFIQPIIDIVGQIGDALNSVLGPVFGGIDFNDLPTPAEVWQTVINTLLLPLNLLLGPNSPLNAGHIFGRLQLPQLPSVFLGALTTQSPNFLEPFTAVSVPSADGWSFDATANAAKVICDGSTKTLYLSGAAIKVESDQPLNIAQKVRYTGVTSGAGQTIQYVLDTFTSDDGSGSATPVVVAGISNPSGTAGTITIGDSSWDIPPGVGSVRPVLVVDDAVSAGSVFWENTPELYKGLDSNLADGLAAAIQARINDIQDTWDAFKGAAGGTVADIETALDNAGQGIRDAIANALGHAGTGHTVANILTYLQNIPQDVVANLEDDFADAGDAIADVFDDVRDGWNSFWDGIFRTSGSTGKTAADVQAAATQVADNADAAQSAATTAQVSTETLSTFFNTPRLVPSWLATQADDASFATTSIDTSVTPVLGQVILIPVKVTQDRIYDAVKFGLIDNTMTNCYVGIYDCDESTGDLTKVVDLGDCKSQLNTSYNQQIVAIPTPISVQRGEVYYIAVLQVGGTAGKVHGWSSTANFTTGLFPRYPGNVYATGSQTALPSSIVVANVLAGSRIWGALGTATTPVTPGQVHISDSFNRSDGALTTPWTVRDGSLSIVSNRVAVPGFVSNSGVATHTTRLTSVNQRVGFTFGTTTGGSSQSGGVLLRGNGAGRHVRLVAKKISGGGGSATILTSTAYSSLGTSRWSVTDLGNGLAGAFVFEAVGNTYSAYRNGTLLGSWTDSGGAFTVGASSTEVGLYVDGIETAGGFVDDWLAQDL